MLGRTQIFTDGNGVKDEIGRIRLAEIRGFVIDASGEQSTLHHGGASKKKNAREGSPFKDENSAS